MEFEFLTDCTFFLICTSCVDPLLVRISEASTVMRVALVQLWSSLILCVSVNVGSGLFVARRIYLTQLC